MTDNTYSMAKGLLINAELPQQTRTYKPISHQQLMDLTLESIYQAGFELDNETYSGARDGQAPVAAARGAAPRRR